MLAALALLAGCMGTRVEPQTQLPPPLIDRVPVRVGVHYPEEFRTYVHKEKRYGTSYEIMLGPAHVKNLDWLLAAMFDKVVTVDDPADARNMQPPLAMVLQPRFEEYSFLTPRDVAGEAFIVTIRYLLSVYDGSGAPVDAFAFTGYGREKGGGIATAEPLKRATQRAMRDAGAKVAVEFPEMDAIRLLLRGHAEAARPSAPGG